MTAQDKAARERAQAAVARVTALIRFGGVGLPPNEAMQRVAILDTEVLALVELLGGLLPGGEAAVWDAVARRAHETAERWESRRVRVASGLPRGGPG